MLRQVEADKKKALLISSVNPPYSQDSANSDLPHRMTNRQLLEGDLRITRKSIDERIKISQGLQAYATSLAALAAGPNLNNWSNSVESVVKALGDFKTDNASNLFARASGSIPPKEELEAFAGAVRFIGQQIIELKTKKALKRVIQSSQASIEKITTLLADDIGTKQTPNGDPQNGLRGVFFDEVYGKQLEEEYSVKSTWTAADKDKRGTTVDAALTLDLKRRQIDDLLVALRDSDIKFAQAHSELEKAATESEKFSLNNAISSLSELSKRINEITKALKK